MMLIGVTVMGISLSFLLKVGYGTDTCSFMNASLSHRSGIALGHLMAVTNVLLFIPELIWGRRLIGLGTICNMLLIGYIIDFCMALEELYLPHSLFISQPSRSIVFTVSLLFFLIAVSLYMNADMGQSPFDAVPTLISRASGLPFFAVRICWDFLAIAIGVLAGGTLNIGTVIMAFTIGPAVSWIGGFITSWFSRRAKGQTCPNSLL